MFDSQLEEIIGNQMLLMVETLSFDRGVSSESTKRSTSIWGLKIEDLFTLRRIQALPGIPVHEVQLATTATRAWL